MLAHGRTLSSLHANPRLAMVLAMYRSAVPRREPDVARLLARLRSIEAGRGPRSTRPAGFRKRSVPQKGGNRGRGRRAPPHPGG